MDGHPPTPRLRRGERINTGSFTRINANLREKKRGDGINPSQIYLISARRIIVTAHHLNLFYRAVGRQSCEGSALGNCYLTQTAREYARPTGLSVG
jgi:hypothetical protein